jgi:class 3 adenylate cyclase/tetratricopeptide (TPR) repeat protein
MLRVRLLGDLAIEVDGTAVEPPASRRARALLGWLALDRRMHPRSRLAARFWPDVLDESARTSLRSALSALRRALGPDSERYLLATRDEVGFADGSLVWTDVAEFERCVEENRLQDALAISGGELLFGLEDDWVYERRDDHRDRLAGVLARLAAGAEQDGDLQTAIEYTRQQVALDSLVEEPQRDLMRRLAAAGDRPAAIRVYERLSRRLRDELRLAPARETRELAAVLRRAGETASPEVGAADAAAAVVTLLFTDLVGSTELLSELGDDEAERLWRAHFGLLRDIATAHAGEGVKNLGDGLMVTFPSVVNALTCAVGIQQAVYRDNARQGDDRLQVRVGLHVGEPIHDEGDYFGTPVVIAKRLCDQADGGQIMASELVRGLVGSRGSFDFRSCGLLALKGIAQPLAACEIGWEPAAERRIALPPSFVGEERATLVGRGAQLEQLRCHWQDARAGRRQVVVLVGEPGIGKTRLAAEFCRSAYEDGALVLLGRCYEDSPVPYQPVVEALRHYVSESPLEALRLAVARHRATLAKLLPELADRSAPAAAISSGTEPPDREQFMLFDAVASLLRTAADEQPLILVLDDLHWADAPTLLLLRHVVRATEGTPLLILGTYRETEVDEAHPLAGALAELRRARTLQTLRLQGLDEQEVAAMISSQSGRTPPTSVARAIVERTQGNPFFVEELLREVAAEADFTEALTRIPDTVKDLLVRRLRRLDDGCQRVLTIAAATGREFALDIIHTVTRTTAEEVTDSLEQALAAQVLRESSIGHYSFAHALIRETIYERLSRTRRAQLHRQIGEAIESLVGDQADEQAGPLAYHFSVAGDVAKAYQYHSRAAVAAQLVCAVEPALTHCTEALDAASRLGLDAHHEPALRVLLFQRGRLRWRSGDLDGATADLDAALDAARRSGDRVVEMETLNELGMLSLRSNPTATAAFHEAALEIALDLGDTAAETHALGRLAVISTHQLEFDRALTLGERALELARGTGDPAVVGRAMDSIKLAVWQLGDLRRLEELTAELEPLWRERGDLWYLQWTLLESAFVPIGAARWEQAEQRLADAIAINRRVHDPLAEVLMLDALCWLNRSRGAYETALSAGHRAVTLGAEVGWEEWAAATLGSTLLDLGAFDRAAEVLERGLKVGERIGARNEIMRCLGQLAWARLELGAADEAFLLAARGEELLERVTGGPFLFGAHAYGAVARVLLASGAPERGETLLRPALAAAQNYGWREAAATTGLVVGLCLEARGELDHARATLRQAAELSDESGIPAAGWEAHAALARLADEPDEHLAAAAAIIELMTAGLKDDAIGALMRRRAKL